MYRALLQLGKDDVNADDAIAWAAYHSINQPETSDPPVITALLPLFYEKADTPAMIKHGMDVLRQSITFLNLGFFFQLCLNVTRIFPISDRVRTGH